MSLPGHLLQSQTPQLKTLFVLRITSPRNSSLNKGRGRWVTVKCSKDLDSGSGLNDALSNIVDKTVEELLDKEENKELLDKLNKASDRVELARKQLADIQKRELEALQMRDYLNQLQTKASQIAECQNEVMEARKMVEEAEKTLSMGSEGGNIEDALKEKEEERWESVKAASISALVGSLAAAPIYGSQLDISSPPQFLFQLGITFASCALFGVTFRYAVRRDLDNIQLKTGTAAAFAFVQGLGALGRAPPLQLNSESLFSHALDGAFLVSQDLFIFIFAAVSLDFCFKTRLVIPYPIKRAD